MKVIYFINSVNILVHMLPFIFKYFEVDRRALLSLKHVFVLSIYSLNIFCCNKYKASYAIVVIDKCAETI